MIGELDLQNPAIHESVHVYTAEQIELLIKSHIALQDRVMKLEHKVDILNEPGDLR